MKAARTVTRPAEHEQLHLRELASDVAELPVHPPAAAHGTPGAARASLAAELRERVVDSLVGPSRAFHASDLSLRPPELAPVRPYANIRSMRWDQLKVDNEPGHRLPGFRDEATVRTFDAPEAMDIRFYEVRAKSAMNKVPERSRMPFRWTINPYRDAPMRASTVCRARHPILMGDGRTKALAEGWRRGSDLRHSSVDQYRRYVTTQDARPLVDRQARLPGHARGRHRARRERRSPISHEPRGWKHVTGRSRAAPSASPDDGQQADGCRDSSPQRQSTRLTTGAATSAGWSAATATSAPTAYVPPGSGPVRRHKFRLALTDFEALRGAPGTSSPRSTSLRTSSSSRQPSSDHQGVTSHRNPSSRQGRGAFGTSSSGPAVADRLG